MAQNCSKEPKSSRVVPALKHTAVAPKLKLKAVSNAGLDLLVLQFTYNSFLLSTYTYATITTQSINNNTT